MFKVGPLPGPLPSSIGCEVGQTCQVLCNATGNPTPNVTWSDNGVEIVTGSGTAVLTLNLTEHNPCTTYTCYANNDVKNITVGKTTVCPLCKYQHKIRVTK